MGQTPGGFESLLATAAGRAQCSGVPVVLVVDGLDEADTPGEGLPFGLPSLLPDGVYVVGTYRTGRSPGRPDAPSTTLRIAQGRSAQPARHPRVPRQGWPARMSWRPGWPKPARTRPSSPGCWPSGAAEYGSTCGMCWMSCGSGCGGRMKSATCPPGCATTTPTRSAAGRQDPAWHTGLLPLLATLGVAGEALPAAALARLAGNIDPVAVQRWCDLTIRPLLTTTRHRQRERRFGTRSTMPASAKC